MAAALRHRRARGQLLGAAAAALALAALAVLLLGSGARATAAPIPPSKQAAPPTAPTATELDPAQAKISSRDDEEEEGEEAGGACSDGIGSSITNTFSVPCMTEEAVRTIFGLPKGGVKSKALLAGILEIPDFVDSPRGGIGGAEALTRSIGFALLMAVVTFTLLHYLAAGFLSSGGNGAIIDGVARCAGAAILILAWPFLYENVANVTNVVSLALLPERGAGDAMTTLMAAAAVGGGIGLGLLVLIAFGLLLICLLMVKIGLLIGLLLAFVGMPLALALWPIPSLSAPVSYAFRYIGMAFSVVVMWALCFKVLGAIGLELRRWGGGHLGFAAALLLPLLGIGQLLALLAIPRHAVTMWNVSPRKGTAGSMVQFAASNFIGNQLNGLARRAGSSSRSGGRPGTRPPGRRPRGPGGNPGGGIGPAPSAPGAPSPGGGARPKDDGVAKRVKLGAELPEGGDAAGKGRRSEHAPAARHARQGYGNARRKPGPHSRPAGTAKPHSSRGGSGQGTGPGQGGRAGSRSSGRAPVRSGFGGSGPPPRAHDAAGSRGSGSTPSRGQGSPPSGPPAASGQPSPTSAHAFASGGAPGGNSPGSAAKGGAPSKGAGSRPPGPGPAPGRPDAGGGAPNPTPPPPAQQPPPSSTD